MSAGFQWGRGRHPTLGGCEPLGDAGREPLTAPGSRERRREREAERDRDRYRETEKETERERQRQRQREKERDRDRETEKNYISPYFSLKISFQSQWHSLSIYFPLLSR